MALCRENGCDELEKSNDESSGVVSRALKLPPKEAWFS